VASVAHPSPRPKTRLLPLFTAQAWAEQELHRLRSSYPAHFGIEATTNAEAA
jgi:hypothetical protein